MLWKQPIMLLSSVKFLAYYAQNYAHESWEYATINWRKNHFLHNLTVLLEYIYSILD